MENNLNELYEEAKEIVIEHQQASIPFLQRRLMLTYRETSKIMDMLEENCVVGKSKGTKPRDVLIKE